MLSMQIEEKAAQNKIYTVEREHYSARTQIISDQVIFTMPQTF